MRDGFLNYKTGLNFSKEQASPNSYNIYNKSISYQPNNITEFQIKTETKKNNLNANTPLIQKK